MRSGSISRRPSTWARGLGLLALAALGGCGNRTSLPQQHIGGVIPPSNTYRVKQVWTGFEAASDLILTSGSQVFVAFPERGEVVGYYRTSREPRPNGTVIAGGRPTFLAEGAGRELVIADADTAGGGRVRIIDLRAGGELSVFSDSTWGEIGGIAADDSSNVYASDRTRNVVRKYDRAGSMLIELADEGSGIGFVQGPGELDWQPGLVIVADTGKGWVQGLDPWRSNTAFFFLNGAEGPLGPFGAVADVGGDEEGNLYVADSGLGAVLKYTGAGDFDQRVDENAPAGSAGHLEAPVAVSASATLVFVLDRSLGKIVTFELDR